jgi:pSer/pThr/pTyr-binding forkhead associated (FHA) protein
VNQNNEQGLVPKELILEATKEKTRFKIGRSAKNDGSVNLKELSSEHCTIEYSETVGWVLTENYNERPSSNGTSVFMKSYIEMIEQSPSSLIRVRDGMILAFVNFQAELKLVPKSTTVIANNSQALESSKNDIISNLNHT